MATREQLSNDTDILIHNTVRTRVGQRFTLSNYLITDLSFLLRKIGTPEALNVTFTIRKVSDDTVIASKVLSLATALQTTDTWETVTFDSPALVDEDVRVSCEYAGTTGYPDNGVVLRYQASDVAASENMCWYPGSWVQDPDTYDAAYKLTYTNLPTVTTQAATNVKTASATGNGNITDIGSASVTEHGHCWSTSANPTTADSKTTNGAGSAGAFTSAITGLLLGTLYHTRAYATNSYGTSYGADVEFTTLSFIGQVWII